MNDNLYVKEIQGFFIGLIILWFFYIVQSERFNTLQKVIIFITAPFLPLSLLIALFFYLMNRSNIFKSKQTINNEKSIKNAIALKDLLDKGILSKEEYEDKNKQLQTETKELNIKYTKEYKNLKNLYDSKILTKIEFDKKIELLNTNETINSKSENFNEKLTDEKRNEQCEIKYVYYKTERGLLSIPHCLNFVGQRALINNIPAPDGKYYLNNFRYVEIKNGIIVKNSAFSFIVLISIVTVVLIIIFYSVFGFFT